MWPCKYRIIAALSAFSLAVTPTFGQQSRHASYTVINLGSLAGDFGEGNTINNLGWVMGASTPLADSENLHATLWANGFKFDLKTLGGPNSGVEWPVKNVDGLISGISETADLQPLGEQWSCAGAFFLTDTGHVCKGFAWRWGWMTALPTLGGDNGFAAGNNEAGQIVGWAETPVHDSTCISPQVLQFEAVLYDPDGGVHELPPLPGDPDGAATAINSAGDTVGISGLCDVAVGASTAEHAVLWHHGQPVNLGGLGGSAWNTPTSINDRGAVVGFADLPGDSAASPNFHAFLWTPETGRMVDLGTLAGDSLSEALGINNRGQIVGVSYGAGFSHPRGFLWQDGMMVDLNSLVAAGSPLYIIDPNDINDEGQISGQACNLSSGTCGEEMPAFVAYPNSDPRDMRPAIEPPSPPESLRLQLQRGYFFGSPIHAQFQSSSH